MLRCLIVLLSVFAKWAYADSTTSFTTPNLSFTPPPGDVSIGFLGNLFGLVDGVLFGTGSQIMGSMFAVFNSGVLALGGILILYIIVVATMNTAHEGEMLGHKWSSIWIPIRSTIGLALLIPKASGYCLMQIFVMWVVVQGVGLADKVWNAALDYLNRGGVIVHSNIPPPVLTGDSGQLTIAGGAANILYSQVCMLGLQTVLQTVRNQYLDQAGASPASGPCAGTPSATMQTFCDTPIPDFIGSVDPIAAPTPGSATSPYSVPMPNIQSEPYNQLNGLCGTLTWNQVDTSSFSSINLSQDDIDTVASTRSLAVSQLYSTLSLLAQTLVNNDPQINTNANTGGSTPASPVAMLQYGIPYTSQFTPCTNSSEKCPNWGADSSMLSQPVLLQGLEFLNALDAYNAVMAPTLNLVSQAQNASAANNARTFINQSKTTGWMLAGSYFFNLVQLNGNATAPTSVDSNSGLNKTSFVMNNLTAAFGANKSCDTTSQYVNLCYYANKNQATIQPVVDLINGQDYVSGGVTPQIGGSNTPVVTGVGASTLYGYVTNGSIIYVPPQAGTVTGPTFVMPYFNLGEAPKYHASVNPCLKMGLLGKLCFGKIINPIVQIGIDALNWIVQAGYDAATFLATLMFFSPLQGMMYVFIQGMWVLQQPGINPVVAIAQMGISYINYAMALVMFAIAQGVVSMLVNPAIVALFLFMLPFFLTLISAMLAMAVVQAYYIPFLPYMIFTFGAIAWLGTVVEAMVAAPVVALGVAHPEGHDALGKAEQGLMILINVFLRPTLMIVGYIAAIAMSYVSVWILNASFQNVLDALLGTDLNYSGSGASIGLWGQSVPTGSPYASKISSVTTAFELGIPWGIIFGYFFASITFASLYMTVVEKSFGLIAQLPDTVLRWIGGQAEQTGRETMQWSEATKSQLKEQQKDIIQGASAAQEKAAGNFAKAGSDLATKGVYGLGGSKISGT